MRSLFSLALAAVLTVGFASAADAQRATPAVDADLPGAILAAIPHATVAVDDRDPGPRTGLRRRPAAREAVVDRGDDPTAAPIAWAFVTVSHIPLEDGRGNSLPVAAVTAAVAPAGDALTDGRTASARHPAVSRLAVLAVPAGADVSLDDGREPGTRRATLVSPDLDAGTRVLWAEVEAEATDAGTAVRPNPAQDWARISFVSTASGPVRVSVSDVRGREVSVPFDREVLAGESITVALDVRPLATGTYVVVVAGENRTSRTFQVVR